jgi:hypothetical protein
VGVPCDDADMDRVDEVAREAAATLRRVLGTTLIAIAVVFDNEQVPRLRGAALLIPSTVRGLLQRASLNP